LKKFSVEIELRGVDDMETMLDTFRDMKRRDQLEVFIPWKLYLEHHREYLEEILWRKSTKRKRESSNSKRKKQKKAC
jgi:hypothetical protein